MFYWFYLSETPDQISGQFLDQSELFDFVRAFLTPTFDALEGVDVVNKSFDGAIQILFNKDASGANGELYIDGVTGQREVVDKAKKFT